MYEEDLEDLQGICEPCHEYLHHKRDRDPLEDLPPPIEVQPEGQPAEDDDLERKRAVYYASNDPIWRFRVLADLEPELTPLLVSCYAHSYDPEPDKWRHLNSLKPETRRLVGRDRPGEYESLLSDGDAPEIVMRTLEWALFQGDEFFFGPPDPDGDPEETNCDEDPFYEPPVPPSH
jgi:hypothetical protein